MSDGVEICRSDKVEQQAVRKAFNMMDVSKRGRLGWREFKYIIRQLRPGSPPWSPPVCIACRVTRRMTQRPSHHDHACCVLCGAARKRKRRGGRGVLVSWRLKQ